VLLSSVNKISFSVTPGDSLEGEGDKTTEGIRWCPRLEPGVEPSVEACLLFSEDIEDDAVGGEEIGVTFDGSQSNPGLMTKLMVSPSLIGYSCKSFPSASAFPFRRRRWTSAGGAEGCDASCVFMEDMVSVGCTDMVKVACGLEDLKVTEIEAKEEAVICGGCRAGGAGTAIGRTGTFLSEFSGGCW